MWSHATKLGQMFSAGHANDRNGGHLRISNVKCEIDASSDAMDIGSLEIRATDIVMRTFSV